MWRRRGRRELAEVSEPGLGSGDGAPSLLLRPERAVVAFTGRDRELGQLRAWCRADDARAVRVVAGAGGVGKTRLALEVAAEWAPEGGLVVQVPPGTEVRSLEQARVVSKGPVLLIVDDAETRGGLGALLEAVLADPGPVRVLLVTRSLGEWWDRLTEESTPAAARLLAEHDPVLLDAQVADVPDADLAAAAVRFFAGGLGVRVPKGVVFGLPAHRVPVLVLQAAALVAVLRSRTSPPGSLRVPVTSGVLGELLEHEARYWQRTAAAAGLSGDSRVLNAVVAALVVVGTDDEDQAAAVAGRVPDLAGLADEELCQWGKWLAGLYPGADGEMGSVQPELLAEHHAVMELAADPVLAQAVLSGLDGRQGVHALTVLGLAWELHDEAGPVIEAALRADLAGLAPAAGQVTIATQPRIGRLLAEALDAAPPTAEDLARIAETLPYPSDALAGAHLAVALRVRRELPPGTGREDAARWAQRCGLLLSQASRPADALSVTLESVSLYREIADELPDRYRPDLASSLTRLGILFSALGRPADALAVAEEAVAIRRELAAALPDRYCPDLAFSLYSLGVRLGDVGRPAEALPVAEEAVSLYRELAAALPDQYRSGASLSLSSLSKVLSALGREDEAAAAATERASLRPLIEIEPDRFEDMVTTALDGLPEKLGRLMENVAVTVDHDGGRPGLLGLYQGIPLTKRRRNYGMRLPDKITIYRRAICANCRSEQEVIEKVRRVVIHEVGHHFGIDDDRLKELGW